MSTIEELEKSNDKTRTKKTRREKYLAFIGACAVSFVIGYIVGLF